jgi:hypothetical protein
MTEDKNNNKEKWQREKEMTLKMVGGTQQSKTTLAIVREAANKLQQPPVLRTPQSDTNLSQEETWQWIDRDVARLGIRRQVHDRKDNKKCKCVRPKRSLHQGFHATAATHNLSNQRVISMQLNPSPEANSCSDTQEIARYLWNLKVHYADHSGRAV